MLRKTKILDFVENFETDPKERKSLLSKKKCGAVAEVVAPWLHLGGRKDKRTMGRRSGPWGVSRSI